MSLEMIALKIVKDVYASSVSTRSYPSHRTHHAMHADYAIPTLESQRSRSRSRKVAPRQQQPAGVRESGLGDCPTGVLDAGRGMVESRKTDKRINLLT